MVCLSGKEEILALHDKILDLFNKRETEEASKMYADDAIMYAQNERPAQGTEGSYVYIIEGLLSYIIEGLFVYKIDGLYAHIR